MLKMLPKKSMKTPVNPVYVPRFAPQQLSSSQREARQPDWQPDWTPDLTEPASQCRGDGHGGKRGHGGKNRFVLKVKLPKSKRATKEDNAETPRRLMLEPEEDKSNCTERGEEIQRACTTTESGGGHVFCFSERQGRRALSDKEKAKLAVLRTVSRMLEENQLIRARLVTLCQNNTP